MLPGFSRSRLVGHAWPDRVRPAASEVERLVGDNTKLTALTAWQSACSLEQGLEQTVDWFRDLANLARYKSWLYNV